MVPRSSNISFCDTFSSLFLRYQASFFVPTISSTCICIHHAYYSTSWLFSSCVLQHVLAVSLERWPESTRPHKASIMVALFFLSWLRT